MLLLSALRWWRSSIRCTPSQLEQIRMVLAFRCCTTFGASSWPRLTASSPFCATTHANICWRCCRRCLSMALRLKRTNTMVRINPDTKEITGFIMRDYIAIKFHRDTLVKSTQDLLGRPVHIEKFQSSIIEAQNIERVYSKAYHTIIHCYLASMIRALGLYRSHNLAADRLGWRIESSVAHDMA
ncbi:hypothetical protein GQ42DRAFT_171263 [Ramicandelaber brevisporus]|nr:hypothetical protein GQ42DRAFT_171263 [Ramicandelaber brevisporus]